MILAIISDIHSDLLSLKKALFSIRESGCEKILCLGDIVGYGYHYASSMDGRDSNACISLVRENCSEVICGNHDLHAIRKLPSNYRELGIPDDWYDLDLGEQIRISGGRFWLYDDELSDPISTESRNYLDRLPEMKVIREGGLNILATHFVHPDITGSMQGSPSRLEDFRDHLELLKNNRCLLGLAGHAHLEGYAQISRKALGMNYFRKARLLRRPQLIVVPAVTRGKGKNGYLIIDTEKLNFEAIALN
jgi:predicted phosphodiesterase